MTGVSSIDEIFGLFRRFGDLRYGEDVTQLEHVLQAAQMARNDGADDSLVAAALLHDIGQFLNDAGRAADEHGIDARHEISGAAVLARNFGPEISEPIRLHVAAKRYLCAVEAGYEAALSRASAISLRLQGGPFDAAEQARFEAESHFAAAVRLRRYDDLGKRTGWAVADLESYRPLLARLLLKASAPVTPV